MKVFWLFSQLNSIRHKSMDSLLIIHAILQTLLERYNQPQRRRQYQQPQDHRFIFRHQFDICLVQDSPLRQRFYR